MRELPQETLIVFVSDCHVGGDPGCDSFEASEELGSLFEELAMHGRPLELVLAEDFFDLLLISDPPEGRPAAGRGLGASEARRSTPDEAREAGEPGQDTPNLRGRQTARDRRLRDSRMKFLWHWKSRCVT